ncbi:YheC/YheD family protein [Paenibacillus thermotolerans]|uniref:YheC/YheD family endospore coat-associated protein n=1 Tax=Paenibacillus thermotolerans TaxID=3027807 RepID=UPI002368E307|nr:MULTISPECIES: YheC/YheD family protein [unclassified Paenibacillus]
MSERIVGILVNDEMLKGIPRGRTGHENISFYEECAAEYGLKPAYFRLSDISMRREQVRALVKEGAEYRFRSLPLPKVIHNRAMFRNYMKADRKLEALCALKGTIVFNRWNRYGKWHVHQLLKKNRLLRPHLPETKQASEHSINKLFRKHGAIIVKPNSSSIGRGIMKIEREEDHNTFTYPSSSRKSVLQWKTVRYKGKLPAALLRSIKKKPYLAQQRLNLATYGGRPFDMRVSVQRGMKGTWQVTGIAAKVAGKNVFVTNVAQGGTVLRLAEALRDHPHLNPAAVQQSIEKFALAAAEHLSGYIPFLSDVGFDIGVTPEGFPVFIEMNLRDQRYAFCEGGMMEQWKKTYANPLAYAKYLLDSQSLIRKDTEGRRLKAAKLAYSL